MQISFIMVGTEASGIKKRPPAFAMSRSDLERIKQQIATLVIETDAASGHNALAVNVCGSPTNGEIPCTRAKLSRLLP